MVVGVPRYPVGEQSPLQILASVLKRMRWLTTAHAIETAQVPVVKLVFQFEGTLLHVDVTFDFKSSVSDPTSSTPSRCKFEIFFGFYFIIYSKIEFFLSLF